MKKPSVRIVKGLLISGLLFAAGYVCGQGRLFQVADLVAQEDDSVVSQLSEDSTRKVKAVFSALNDASATLQGESRYRSAIRGVNAFAVTAGGIDAIRDLEEGRGVDPETFAGLYAGLASEDIAEHISFNESGQVMYKDKLVRLYSTGRLKRVFAQRSKMAGL